jgi:secretion/DNA translocation related CpaE-like protein
MAGRLGGAGRGHSPLRGDPVGRTGSRGGLGNGDESGASGRDSVRGRSGADPAGRPRPLLVTADPDLLDDLLRLIAEAGLVADVAPDPSAARPWFARAGLVLIGVDCAQACVRAALPRRPGLILVGTRSLAPGDAPADWQIAEALGADRMATLPAAEPWLIDQLRDLDDLTTGHVISVLGGRGGAGASVLAGALAVTAAHRGLRTLLVDADPLGGGLDLVLGWEALAGARWPALSQTSGRVHPPALVEALPGRGDLAILSWDRGEPVTVPPEAMLAALDAGRRGRDLTVIDLARRLDESAILALRAADRTLLVVPTEIRACAAAARVVAGVTAQCADVSLVVRHSSPGGLTVAEVAGVLGLPVAGTLRHEPRVAASLERGHPPTGGGPGSLADLCDKLLAGLRDESGRVA